MIWEIVGSLVLSIIGIAVYYYYHCKGQFEDPEDVKYQMFRDEESS